MKTCPRCSRTYEDPTLSFCLMDGAPLAALDSEPTVVLPPGGSLPTHSSAPTEIALPRPKRRAWPLMAIIAAVLVIGGIFMGVIFLIAYRLGSESVRLDRSVSNTSTPQPKASATQKQSASASPLPSASASPVSSQVSQQTADDEEFTPIQWSTSAISFKQEDGLTYKFECPPNGQAAIIWGSDIYTADSAICTAAVHAGVITLQDGGRVVIVFRPGRSIYGATTRNGITSYNFGEYAHSYVVRKPTDAD